jgi:tetratricopeptide (TPR) repeat protein
MPEENLDPHEKSASWMKRLLQSLRGQRRGDVIAGSVSGSARGVAIGKNFVQIGTLVVPARLVIILVALLVGLVAGSAFLAWNLWVPDRMTGLFNVAVAEFGQVDAQGHVHPSQNGQLISKRLSDGLEIEFENLPVRVRQDFQPQLWQDSMGITQKRSKIGIVPGDTPQARQAAVRQIAKRINAHVVIYGNLPAEGTQQGFVPDVYVADNAGLGVDADRVAGNYQLGGAIPAQLLDKLNDPIVGRSIKLRLNSWTNVMSLFSIGLMYDLLGYPDRALPVLQQAKDELVSTANEGTEVLWYFIGRENLWLKRYDEAQAAFEQALRAKPNYARARLGLGDVYNGKTESLSLTERLQQPDLERSIAEYQQALVDARGSNEAAAEIEALYSLGSIFRLKGETQLDLADYEAADASLITAIGYVSATVPALTAAEHYRLLAQAYLTLGEAYTDRGHVQLRLEHKEASRPFFEEAYSNYGQCIKQQDAAPADLILTDKIVAKLCVPYKQSVEEILSSP